MVFKAYRYKLLQCGLDAVLRLTHNSMDNLKYTKFPYICHNAHAESSELSLPEFTEQMKHVLFLVSQLQCVKGQMSGIQYGALKSGDTCK
jgi:hypothetical protein